jgi:hypothetical protein
MGSGPNSKELRPTCFEMSFLNPLATGIVPSLGNVYLVV